MMIHTEEHNVNESAVDIVLTARDSSKNVSTITKNVITPQKYLKEDFVEIKYEVLEKIDEILTEAENAKWPLSEILLGISTCCIGGSISALCSHISITTCLGKVMYILLPVIATGTIVAYFFTRSRQVFDLHKISKDIKKLLPSKEEIFNEHQ